MSHDFRWHVLFRLEFQFRRIGLASLAGHDFRAMFYSASSFNSDVSAWQVSQATTFERMFSGASSFNSDVSAWQVSNVTTFDCSLSPRVSIPTYRLGTYRSHEFRHVLWRLEFQFRRIGLQVSQAKTFGSIFSFASSFESTYRLGKSRRPRLSNMFYSASSFNSDVSLGKSRRPRISGTCLWRPSFNSDVSAWQVSQAKTFEGMFYGASSFNSDVSACKSPMPRISFHVPRCLDV